MSTYGFLARNDSHMGPHLESAGLLRFPFLGSSRLCVIRNLCIRIEPLWYLRYQTVWLLVISSVLPWQPTVLQCHWLSLLVSRSSFSHSYEALFSSESGLLKVIPCWRAGSVIKNWTALAEDLSSVSSIAVRWLTKPGTSSSRGSANSGLCRMHTHFIKK